MPPKQPQIIDERGNRVYCCIDRIEAAEQLGMAQLAYDLSTLHAPESHDYDLDDDARMQQDFAGLEG